MLIIKILILILCFYWSSPAGVLADSASSVSDTLPEQEVKRPWLGDLDGMIERRTIRALVVYSKTFYFLDRGRQRGLTYEALKEFEGYINRKLKTKTLKISVVMIPVSREQLIPFLKSGKGDIAAANLTITPQRLKSVDFSKAALTNVKELVVTGHKAPSLRHLSDLSGMEIHVRKSSSYFDSLVALNKQLVDQNLAPVKLALADEYLEDEDLLEMVNAGLIPAIVMDNHKALFWKQIFPSITVHEHLAVRKGASIGWAFRKNSPKLKQMVDGYIKTHKKGTLIGNILFKRYLRNTRYVKNALAEKEMAKFKQTVALFRKYADQYRFDWLMITAQGYQESQLDQSKRSPVGAIGVMQLLPSTAADKQVGIPDIEDMEKNIHAGTKYMRFIVDHYFSSPQIDPFNRTLFGFAAYNAGPNRISRLRREAKKLGLDPNIWFNNVEIVAAKRIGRETVQYVRNILKYWIAYRKVVEAQQKKQTRKGT